MSDPERWAAVPGFEGQYAVSTLGRVYSFRSDRVLRPGRMSGGHLSVALGRGNSRCVHDLVLSAFAGPRPPGYEGRHLNGVHSDNRLSNLEWATKSRNGQDKKWHDGARTYKLAPDDIAAIKFLLREGMKGGEIAPIYNVNRNTIYAIRDGKIHADVG